MFGFFRNRGVAAVITAFAAFFATPSTAIAAQAAPIIAAEMPAPVPTFVPAVTQTLDEMVISFVDRADQDAQEMCLAKAVYFEARSESLEGQLAVAEVILNRVASDRYPDTICDVVTQPAQFSFIRRGRFPQPKTGSDAWHRALAIADIAQNRLANSVAPNVLWYHATYVAPSWGKRLTRFAQIGTHIFYS